MLQTVYVQMRTDGDDFVKVQVLFRRSTRFVKLVIRCFVKSGVSIFIRLEIHPCVVGRAIVSLTSLLHDDPRPWDVFVIAMNAYAVKLTDKSMRMMDALGKVVEYVEKGFSHYLPHTPDKLQHATRHSTTMVDVLRRLRVLSRRCCGLTEDAIVEFLRRKFASRLICRSLIDYAWKPSGPLATKLLRRLETDVTGQC